MIRLIAAFAFAACSTLASAAEEIVTLPTRPGVTLSYLLVRDPSAPPKIVAVSFVGGLGAINLAKRAEKGPVKFGPGANFLVRIRDQLADGDLADAIVDSPSDQLPDGMSDAFRLGKDHAADIGALVNDLKKRFPVAKVFLIGTSRGTISAAALGATLGDAVQGIVLSSTLTNADKVGEGLSRFDFATIKVPILLVHHRDDGCRSSPYANAAALAKQYPLVSVSGGDQPQSQPCEAMSPHGYLGREVATAQAMKSWMLGRDFPREIR